MTTPESDPADVFAQQPSTWSRIRDTAATLPPGGGIGDAYRAGKQLAAESAPPQSAATHWGYVGADASTHGTGAPADDSAGSSVATSEDIAGLHSRLDQVQASIGGIQNGGGGQGSGQGNQNMQQLTPSRMPPRTPQVSPLAASAEARGRALDQMAASGQQLASTRANTVAHFQQRQAAASAGMAAPGGTGNGIGASTGAVSMNGILRGSPMHPSSGVGASPETFANTKWSGQ